MTLAKTILDTGSTPVASTTLIGDKMFNIIKKILGITNKSKTKVMSSKSNQTVYDNHDIIDYDGMGNQGRFPKSKK